MAKKTKVAIYHPVVGEAFVEPSAVSAWLRKGWLEQPEAEKLDLLPVAELDQDTDESEE